MYNHSGCLRALDALVRRHCNMFNEHQNRKATPHTIGTPRTQRSLRVGCQGGALNASRPPFPRRRRSPQSTPLGRTKPHMLCSLSRTTRYTTANTMLIIITSTNKKRERETSRCGNCSLRNRHADRPRNTANQTAPMYPQANCPFDSRCNLGRALKTTYLDPCRVSCTRTCCASPGQSCCCGTAPQAPPAPGRRQSNIRIRNA
jgi:hypothetical protein